MDILCSPLLQRSAKCRRNGQYLLSWSVLLTVCLGIIPCSVGENTLTFQQALREMETKHEELMVAHEDEEYQRAAHEVAKGLRLPKAELDIKKLMMDGPIIIGVDPIPVGLCVQDKFFNQGEITVTLPLYTGGRIDAANKAAEARIREAQTITQTTRHALLTELSKRYYGLYMSRELCKVTAQEAESMQQHANRAKRLSEEGIIAKVEYLNADVAAANAERSLKEVNRDLQIVEEGFRNLLVTQETPVLTSPLFIAPCLESLEVFQEYVDEEHPILGRLAAKHEQAHQGVRAEIGANRPQLYTFGKYELVPDDLTMLDPEWVMGIGLKYTLFDGGQGKNKVRAARSLERKVSLMQDKIQRDLRSLVLKRYQEMEKAHEQYLSLEKTVLLTEENLRVRKRAFEEGLATSVEVVDASTSRAKARLGRLKAAYDFDVAFFGLLEASGRSDRWREYMKRTEAIREHEVTE